MKDQIIKTIERHSVGRHFGEYREITHEDCEDIADELLTEFEQEKKELALKVLQDVKCNLGLNPDLHIIDGFNQRIEQEKREVAREILNDLKGLLEGYIHTNENITLYEYYCKKYGVEV